MALSPTFPVPPHLTDPTGRLRVWLTDPPGMADQLVEGTHFSVELARWLAGPATVAMTTHGARSGVTRFRFLHDWRGVTSHDSAARSTLVDWGRGLGPSRIERIELILSASAPALLRMAAHAGTTAMKVVGISCDIADDVPSAIRRLGIQPARQT